MADIDEEKIELPEESVAKIAELVEEQRAWVLAHLEEPPRRSSISSATDQVRIKVDLLIHIAQFLEKLSVAQTREEMDDLLEFDLHNRLSHVPEMFDLRAFPDYENIVVNALGRCLNEAARPGIMGRPWRRHAMTVHNTLGRGIKFDDSKIPGYADAWKAAFVAAVEGAPDFAIGIVNSVGDEVNFREIPNYEALVKEKYYSLMLQCHGREDEVLRATLGEGLDYSDRGQKIIEKMAEYLNDVRPINVVGILYILKKFGPGVGFNADSIENFESGIKAAFLCCLQNGNLGVPDAKKIKDKLGAGINFDDEARTGIVYNLDHFKDHEEHWFKRAIDIKEVFGEGINISADPECQRAVVGFCMKMLETPSWRTQFVASMKEKLGGGINFSDETVAGYSKVVKEAFLSKLKNGDAEDAVIIRDTFGQGVDLSAAKLEGYGAAIRDGFKRLVKMVSVDGAKFLADELEEGAEIEDKADIVQQAFLELLQNGKWEWATQLQEGFAPNIMCDRKHIDTEQYDLAFRNCLLLYLTRSMVSDIGTSRQLHEQLGEGVDITDLLRTLIDERSDKFIAFANKDHWRAVFGDKAINRFLEALPKRTDEKRNAFTHNAYDRTTQFLAFLERTGLFSPDAEGFKKVTKFVEQFGLARSQNLCQLFYALDGLKDGETVPKEISVPGINTVADLEARINDLRQKVYGDEPILELGDLNEIERELLALVTGKSAHHFDGSRPTISTIIEDFNIASKGGEIAGTPEGYNVESMDVAETSIEFDPDTVQDDYLILKKEIVASVENPGDVAQLIRVSVAIADEKLGTLSRLGDAPYITDQIEKVKALRSNVEAAKNLDELMTVMLQTKFMGKRNPFDSVMRRIVFRKIFMKNRSPEALADMLARLSGEEVTGPNILEIIGMIDDVVKHHALNMDQDDADGYWGTNAWATLKNSRRDSRLVDVRKIFMPHIDRLREAANKFELVSTGKKLHVRSVPDRGFVGEMSGYLADVCYTAEYPLLQPRPNLIPHKLVVGEGREAEFFGSYLVFELEEDAGEKVMLVRGFNVPREANIDIVQFIETTFDRLAITSRKRGITKIVVPGIMGALTNYPLTKNYLYNRYIRGREAITLREVFAFNNYDLTNSCFTVRTIDQQGIAPDTNWMANKPLATEAPPATIT